MTHHLQLRMDSKNRRRYCEIICTRLGIPFAETDAIDFALSYTAYINEIMDDTESVMFSMIYGTPPFSHALRGPVNTYPGRDSQRDAKHEACVRLWKAGKITKVTESEDFTCWGPL